MGDAASEPGPMELGVAMEKICGACVRPPGQCEKSAPADVGHSGDGVLTGRCWTLSPWRLDAGDCPWPGPAGSS